MVKYEIIKYSPSDFGVLKDKKIVKKSNLNKYLNDDWILIRKRYFILTHFLDFWLGLNTDQKINVIAIITASVIALFALF